MPPLEIVQNCYVVRNLEAACTRWHRLFGVGPFTGGGTGRLENHVYRGTPAPPIEIRGVFVQSGELNIELIELVSAAPSAFHDMFPDGGEGLHHAAIFCADYEAEKARFIADGLEVASEFTTGFGAKICYIDTRVTHGHMIELYPENAIIRNMYAQPRDKARNWSGSPLIVPWD